MKLELKGNSIMLFASLILLAGCKQKTGMEILNSQMSGLKALKSQYVVHKEGEKDILVNVLYSKPNRILMTSDDFVVALNETDGHFESIFSQKTYDFLPWDGIIYPGTGTIVSTLFFEAGPPVANPPQNLVPSVPWKLEGKNGHIEMYTKTVRGADGPQIFKLEVTDGGVPVKFVSANGLSYIVKSFELVDSIPFEKFRVEPKDGFVTHRTAFDTMKLESGATFTWSKFKAAGDMNQFKLEGNTMFILVDPNEPTSANVNNWLKTPGQGFKKITVSKGISNTGFYDPNGAEINKMTSSTPTFVMVNKASKIIGLWLGFDQSNVVEFDKDIQSVINKSP